MAGIPTDGKQFHFLIGELALKARLERRCLNIKGGEFVPEPLRLN